MSQRGGGKGWPLSIGVGRLYRFIFLIMLIRHIASRKRKVMGAM